MRLKVFRFNKETDESRYDTFELEETPSMTILSALFHVQESLDDSLAFRHSCRGAVCGTCAMLINKVPRLACRTQVAGLLEGKDEIDLRPYPAIEVEEDWDRSEEILVEPLPHLPIIKDLIVDTNKFFENYKKIEPIIKPPDDAPEKERLMSPKDARGLEKYTNCILCAACFGACPINSKDEEYLGPAALAKLFRFYIDPREVEHEPRLLLANDKAGWWGCEFHTNCKRVCPKGVPPNLGIGIARRDLKKAGMEPKKED